MKREREEIRSLGPFMGTRATDEALWIRSCSRKSRSPDLNLGVNARVPLIYKSYHSTATQTPRSSEEEPIKHFPLQSTWLMFPNSTLQRTLKAATNSPHFNRPEGKITINVGTKLRNVMLLSGPQP